MQIDLPRDLLSRLKQLAKTTHKPIHELAIAYLRDSLDDPLGNLPLQERSELKAFEFLSDETLRVIAREQFGDEASHRLQELMDLHNFGQLSADQLIELEQLVAQSNQLMVRKAEAIALLNDRGQAHTFSNLN